MARSRAAKRIEGSIRQRGGTFQVRVYAGVDPVTGKANYLTESTRDEKEADRILRRLFAVDEVRCPGAVAGGVITGRVVHYERHQ